ncbi:putative Protein pim1 [Tripterygium wilfordii]|uniref:Ultraviolet-B receptor UVR8 n=1 Tax=Tripterygium wilfordii TaxID=458696 RepID=A0A7J7CNG2_TRIWF|nr:putative Protein pim1 [Tripterygium wilfordii]
MYVVPSVWRITFIISDVDRFTLILNHLVKPNVHLLHIICQVSCGAAHVVALSEDGLLQAWGHNEYDQLGRGVTCQGLQGACVINSYSKFLDEAPELVKIVKVSCGEYHSAAISEKGEVFTWGLGTLCQLGHCSLQYGNKELVPRRVVALDGIFIKDVACGGVHTCAVTRKGALYAWSWGGSQAGQLGLGPQFGIFSCIPNKSELYLRNIPVLVVPTGVELVACGHSHTLICLRDGRNEEYKDGVTTITNRQLMRNLHMLGIHHRLIAMVE